MPAVAPAPASSSESTVSLRRFGDVSQARFAGSPIDGRVEWRDTPRVSDLDEKTMPARRLVASKSLILFGIAAGYGQDTYVRPKATTANATVSGQTSLDARGRRK